MMTRSVAALVLVLLLGACSEPVGPEALIRANIMAMEEALAERNNGDFMDVLAASFSGGRVGEETLDRDAAQRMLAVYFLRYRNIEVLVSQVDVEVDLYEPALATSTARVALAGGERLLPESAGLYTVHGQWQNFDGEWKLTRLTWE
jgi:hypothetical protein